jgi:hypothetical protein
MFPLMLIMLHLVSLIAHNLIFLQLLLLIFQTLKSETHLSNDSITQCEQKKPGPFTSYNPYDVRPCPTAEQSGQSGRNRKCQRAEILTSTPVKKLQREKFDRKGKEEYVSMPESKKGASLKFVLPRKQRKKLILLM